MLNKVTNSNILVTSGAGFVGSYSPSGASVPQDHLMPFKNASLRLVQQQD